MIERHESWLILRAQLADRAALDELLRNTQGWLYRYLLRLAKDATLADDILQEVFLIIYRKLRWLHAPQHYRSWVYRIASRAAFKALKARAAEPVSQAEMDAAPAPEQPPPESLADNELLSAEMSRLSPNIRAVFLLHYSEGMKLGEVAAVLDLPPGTVKSRLASGLAQLRRRMKEPP